MYEMHGLPYQSKLWQKKGDGQNPPSPPKKKTVVVKILSSQNLCTTNFVQQIYIRQISISSFWLKLTHFETN